MNTVTDTPLTQVAGSTTTFSNTGLTASTTYYYRVVAVNASGIGTPSDEASATTSGGVTEVIFYNVAIPGNSAGILGVGDQQSDTMAKKPTQRHPSWLGKH